MHRTSPQVELFENVVREIECAVFAEVDLDAFQDAEAFKVNR